MSEQKKDLTPEEMAELIAEMRAAGDANMRHLRKVERSRGAISQIRANKKGA
jgi:hypothetical protein